MHTRAKKNILYVTAYEDNILLLDFIAQRRSISQNESKHAIQNGSVYIQKKRILAPSHILCAGDKVTVFDTLRAPCTIKSNPEIVYADNHFAIISKPAGLACIATRQGGQATLDDFIKQTWGKHAVLLHRLDMQTSGLILILLDSKTRTFLSQQLLQHKIKRYYFAIVHGVVTQQKWTIQSRISHSSGQGHSSKDLRTKMAQTHFTLLYSDKNHSLVRASLATGRTHQIRIHLAENGFPIVGDLQYGGPQSPRLALHAHQLSFEYLDGKQFDFHSPLPQELRALINKP